MERIYGTLYRSFIIVVSKSDVLGFVSFSYHTS